MKAVIYHTSSCLLTLFKVKNIAGIDSSRLGDSFGMFV
jgi:hypothetical protein